MKLTKKEIYDHFTFAIEIEEECGYRHWVTCEGYEAMKREAELRSEEGTLSDVDICTKHDYPGMQEFYDGFYAWENSHLGCDKPVNTYYDTVYAVS